MSIQDFNGWRMKALSMKNGDQIVCFYFQPQNLREVSLHDVNHNIFRLNKQNKVIWQVQRNDTIRGPGWWDRLHQHAREKGWDGAHEPFMYFVLKYPDGSTNINSKTGDPPDVATWTPDCTIWLQGSAYQQYILDPETGIARNVTEGLVRPW